MKYPNLLIAVAATLAGGSALAQTAPSQSVPVQTAPVMTDVGPAPAEDRASTGDVVLENSLVRAQRENAFERSATRTGVATVGRGAVRATMRTQTEADLAQARLNQVLDLQGRGAASLNAN